MVVEEGTLSVRRQQGVESRERILDAATALMSERGYRGLTMAALIKSSGLPSASIYWHFGSKDGVLAAVVERGAARFFGSLPAWPGITGEDPAREFQDYLVAVGRAIDDDPEIFAVMVILGVECADSAEVLDPIRRVRASGVAFLARPLAELAQVYGSDVDVDSVAQFCLTVLDGASVARRVDAAAAGQEAVFAHLGTAAVALVCAGTGVATG
jgi:AcrR family transcriptional regulator